MRQSQSFSVSPRWLSITGSAQAAEERVNGHTRKKPRQSHCQETPYILVLVQLISTRERTLICLPYLSTLTWARFPEILAESGKHPTFGYPFRR